MDRSLRKRHVVPSSGRYAVVSDAEDTATVLLRLSVPLLSLRVLAHFGTFRQRMSQRFHTMSKRAAGHWRSYTPAARP